MSFNTLYPLKFKFPPRINHLNIAKPYLVVGPDRFTDIRTDGTNDHVEIQAAIDSLTSGRTQVETVYLRGDFNVAGQILVPSYTHIILDGTITMNSSWTLGVSTFGGVFKIGADNSIVRNVEIEGGTYKGNFFTTYPTEGSTNKLISAIHSYATILDSSFHDFSVENSYSPLRLEKLGANALTPKT